MSTTKDIDIRKSWEFAEFAKFGIIKVAALINKETGEPFLNCTLFRKGKKPNKRLYYSDKIGELTAEKLEELKHELRVVLLTNGRYKICKGKPNIWVTVKI